MFACFLCAGVMRSREPSCLRSMGGSRLYGFSLMCSLHFSLAVLPEKASCPIPAACSSVGTLPGLRDILSLSGSLRCFPCRGIPFRTVIHFLRCSSSMNYPKSTPKRPPAPYIHKVGNHPGKLSISTLSELW